MKPAHKGQIISFKFGNNTYSSQIVSLNTVFIGNSSGYIV
jgi:hypothetical protein